MQKLSKIPLDTNQAVRHTRPVSIKTTEATMERFIAQSIVNIMFWSIVFVSAIVVGKIGWVVACFVWNLV